MECAQLGTHDRCVAAGRPRIGNHVGAPKKAKSHADELTQASLFLGDGEEIVQPAELRILTTYDAEGRQHNAGLESQDDEYERRIAGDVACGTTLDLGTLDLHCAFFTWTADDGTRGVGRYDVLAAKAAP